MSIPRSGRCAAARSRSPRACEIGFGLLHFALGCDPIGREVVFAGQVVLGLPVRRHGVREIGLCRGEVRRVERDEGLALAHEIARLHVHRDHPTREGGRQVHSAFGVRLHRGGRDDDIARLIVRAVSNESAVRSGEPSGMVTSPPTPATLAGASAGGAAPLHAPMTTASAAADAAWPVLHPGCVAAWLHLQRSDRPVPRHEPRLAACVSPTHILYPPTLSGASVLDILPRYPLSSDGATRRVSVRSLGKAPWPGAAAVSGTGGATKGRIVFGSSRSIAAPPPVVGRRPPKGDNEPSPKLACRSPATGPPLRASPHAHRFARNRSSSTGSSASAARWGRSRSCWRMMSIARGAPHARRLPRRHQRSHGRDPRGSHPLPCDRSRAPRLSRAAGRRTARRYRQELSPVALHAAALHVLANPGIPSGQLSGFVAHTVALVTNARLSSSSIPTMTCAMSSGCSFRGSALDARRTRSIRRTAS